MPEKVTGLFRIWIKITNLGHFSTQKLHFAFTAFDHQRMLLELQSTKKQLGEAAKKVDQAIKDADFYHGEGLLKLSLFSSVQSIVS